jgi:hypothetical protein
MLNKDVELSFFSYLRLFSFFSYYVSSFFLCFVKMLIDDENLFDMCDGFHLVNNHNVFFLIGLRFIDRYLTNLVWFGCSNRCLSMSLRVCLRLHLNGLNVYI